MVTIIDYKVSQKADGKEFLSLKLQGGVEPIQSSQTGRFYLTAKTCYIPSTFDFASVIGMIGMQLPGKVSRVACEPYSYTIKETGEVLTLAHQYQYEPEEVSVAEVKHQTERRLLVK